MAISRIMHQTQSFCYLSTQEHLRSFIGRFVYIYTDKGEVSLTKDRVQFLGKSGVPILIPLNAIKDIQVGHFSRWTKLCRLDFIKVRFQEGEFEREVLLTPTQTWGTPTWETNKIVANWEQMLRDGINPQCTPQVEQNAEENIGELSKLFAPFTGHALIPAQTIQRLELARLIFSFRLERDTPCREYFKAMGLGPADLSLEELLTFQDGILIKLTEQHLLHMDEYVHVQGQMNRADFETAHVNLLNSTHHAMAIRAGYDIPLDESLRTIQDYIAHFFRFMPEDIQFPFPQHLIYPAVELVTRFYRR